MKKSQAHIVIEQLERFGSISRNECLDMRPPITRLGAIIHTLKEKGYTFRTKETEHDFVYTLLTAPEKPRKPQYQIINGVAQLIY